MKKAFLILLLTSAFAAPFVLGGCSSEDSSKPAADPAKVPVTPPAAPGAKGGIAPPGP